MDPEGEFAEVDFGEIGNIDDSMELEFAEICQALRENRPDMTEAAFPFFFILSTTNMRDKLVGLFAGTLSSRSLCYQAVS